jgi:hypothetical protein
VGEMRVDRKFEALELFQVEGRTETLGTKN